MRQALRHVKGLQTAWGSSFCLLALRMSWVCLILFLRVPVQAQDGTPQESAQATMSRPAAGLPLSAEPLSTRADGPRAKVSPDSKDKSRALAVLSSLPVTFEPNRGQADPSVEYLSRGPGYSLFLTQTGALISIQRPLQTSSNQSEANRSSLLQLEFIGGTRHSHLEGVAPQTNRSNYFLGDRADRQLTGIPNFGRVRYPSVYPGTDLIFHGDPSQLEFDLNLAPGADPERVRFRLDGADQLSIDSSGDLVAKVASTEFRLHRPVAFQPSAGSDRPVRAEFVLSANQEISFRIGDFDRTRSLTIDPVLSYASFLGGSGADTAYAIALDSQHNFYVSGETGSTDFPISGGVQGSNGGTNDAFVLKIKSDGSGIAYSTFLGGSLVDASQALAVDSTGSAYVTGFTSSANFPTMNALQPALAGGQDIFVTKLSPDGASLVFSTYLGGTGLDTIAAIALDASNNVVLAGTTKSTDFPVVNALEPTLTGTAGNSDAFVAKLKADGSALIFSTYFGGTGVDGATGVAVSSTGNIWVSGGTGSTDLPVVNALQPTFGGGGVTNISPGDAFLAEFKGDGSALLFSTFWGGSGQEQATTLSLDSSDNVFLVGITSSPDFPTHAALQPQLASSGGFNTFIAKFAADGSSAPFSTYFGGSGNDLAFGSATDSAGNIFISGSTSSTNLPVVNSIQSTNAGGSTDGFVSEVSADGSTLLFSTYFGGTSTDSFNRIAVDSSGVYVVGTTQSSDFPTMGTPVNTFGGTTDGVIVRLAGFTPAPDLALSKTHTGSFTAGSTGSYTLTVSNVGNGPTASVITVTDSLPTGLTYSSASGTNWSCAAASQVVTCTNPGPLAANASSAITLNVQIAPNAPISITNTASLSVTGDTNSSNDSATDVASLEVSPPVIAIAFGDSTIGLNGSTLLTFTLSNPGGVGFTGLAFSDTLPTGLVIATPNGLTSTCGGTATATAGSSSIALSGGTLAGGANCTVVVSVTATATGVFNDSASVTSTNGGTGNTSTASLTVIAPFTLATSFNPSTIYMAGTSALLFTFTNPNPSVSLSVDGAVGFYLPTGLTFPSASTSTTTTCPTSHVATTAQDGSEFTMTAFTLAAGASCTVTAQVTGPTAGTFTASNVVYAVYAGVSNTATASLTVTSQTIPLTITANNATRAYGAANPAFSVTASGFVNGDTLAVLSGTLVCSTPATPSTPVGTYPISCSGLTSAKYTITFVPGTLSVTQHPLTITANNLTKAFGQPNPPLTWTATGFVNGESTNVLTTLPTCTTTVTTTSPAGNYPITCSGAAAANYSITYIPGTLTVTGTCHYVSMSLSPSSVPQGGTTRMNGTINSCSNKTQVVSLDFTLSGPLQPGSCGTAETVVLQTPPFALPPGTSQSFSFPVRIPKWACPGSFTVTESTVIKKAVADTTSAVLTVTPR